jgi:hypothetical protein
MSSNRKTDSARSESSGTIGRAVNRAHGARLVFDSSFRPQPDALTNSEAVLGRGLFLRRDAFRERILPGAVRRRGTSATICWAVQAAVGCSVTLKCRTRRRWWGRQDEPSA